MATLPLLLVAFLLLLSPSLALRSAPSAAPTPGLHVFLVAGQSNAEGSDSDPILPEDAPTPSILALQCCNASTSLPPSRCYLNVSSDPMQPCIGAHGISWARPFARSLLTTLPAGDAVVLVQTAIGGTGFGDGTWVAYTGPGFVAAVQKLLHAWELLHTDQQYAKYNITFDGVRITSADHAFSCSSARLLLSHP